MVEMRELLVTIGRRFEKHPLIAAAPGCHPYVRDREERTVWARRVVVLCLLGVFSTLVPGPLETPVRSPTAPHGRSSPAGPVARTRANRPAPQAAGP